MRRLTKRELDALAAIARLTEPRGPTIRELATRLGLSSSCSAMQYVQRLERQGMVSIRPKHSRGVTLTEEGQAVLRTLRNRAAEAGKEGDG